MKTRPLFVSAIALGCLMSGCPKGGGGGGAGGGGGGVQELKRCEVDLKASGFFTQAGTGSSAKVIDSAAMLIGGPGATGRNGDVLLQNDKIKVVIEQPGRVIGPILSGGGIVDADIVRPAGTPGRDAFGRMNIIYSLGRLTSVSRVEVLSDGSSGGPAVVASTGHDSQHDLINLKSLLANQAGLALDFVVDPNKPVSLRSTTYYVLSPGESRVRILTAFCNDGTTTVLAPLIELMDIGAFELFNPGGCNNALGGSNDQACIMEPSKWFGSQGDGVAYAVRSQSLTDLTRPVVANAVLGFGGVVGSFIEGENINGILKWADPDAKTRPGNFAVKAGGQRSYLRDFVVAEDLAAISAVLLGIDAVATGTLAATAKLPDGSPAAGARISVKDAVTGTMTILMVADAGGAGKATLTPGDYKVSASLEGHLVGPELPVTITAGQPSALTLAVNGARRLEVTLKDVAGAASPGKVTVLCAGGPCAFTGATYKQHYLLDVNDRSAATGYIPISGQLSLTLPPGEYDVVVTRGPEYSAWPDTWPASGSHVDLRTTDGAVNAVVGQVVDTTGWMSADLHVHAVNSSDSAVANAVRASNFIAEGVDVLVSTDHDVITDFAPTVRALGAEKFIATMIGSEVTSFSHGHFNHFPMVRDNSLPYGGAFDHAGGEDAPTYRLTELFPAIKKVHPGVVSQLNHPRGSAGVLRMLKVDTATLATHADPAAFNMAAAPKATADDSKLFGDAWDALETANGPNYNTTVLNDWMTFLSRGTVRTATGVSDTHYAQSSTGGYARTWAKLGVDLPADFKSADFADAIRGHHAVVSNGPFIRCTARKLDSAGTPVGAAVDVGDTLSISPAAGETIDLTVDVEAPEWVQFDRVELYTHTTGREAVNGESNSTWPEARIFDKHLLTPAQLVVEPVPGPGNLRLVHVTEHFVVKPTKDTWFVAMVRGVGGRSMWPLTDSQPAAWTNAILVDADGSGKYDDFPLKLSQPLRLPQPVKPVVSHVPTATEFQAAAWLLLNHTDK